MGASESSAGAGVPSLEEEQYLDHVSPALVGAWSFTDIVAEVCVVLRVSIGDPGVEMLVSQVATRVVDDLGQHRCVAGVVYRTWRRRRTPFGVEREALAESLYTPRAARLIVDMSVAGWRG